MFDVGQKYYIERGHADHVGSAVYTVVEIDLPLIKVESIEGVQVFNTHAPSFHSAKPFAEVDMTSFDDF